MHYLLFYEKEPDYKERQLPWEAEHRAYVSAAARSGRLVLAGSLHDPEDGCAMLLFQSGSAAEVENFAADDCYVKNGVVARWYVRKWLTVFGKDAAIPAHE